MQDLFEIQVDTTELAEVAQKIIAEFSDGPNTPARLKLAAAKLQQLEDAMVVKRMEASNKFKLITRKFDENTRSSAH
jgi:hypothetical protein